MSHAQRTEQEGALLRASLDAAIDPQVYLTAVRNGDGRVVDFACADANAAAVGYLQVAREELLGSTLLALLPDQAELVASCADTVESGHPLVLDDYAYPQEMAASQRRYDIRGVRIGDGLTLSWRDITERHKTVELLKDSQTRFRIVADNASEVVMQVDLLGVIQWASPAAQTLLGRPPEQLVGMNTFDLIREDYRGKLISDVDRLVDTGQDSRLRYPCARPDGSSVWVESVSSLVRDGSGQPQFRVVRLRDIDAECQAQAQLQQTQDRLRALADSLLDPVVAVTAVREGDEIVDFVCQEANDAACREFRRPRSDVVGVSVRHLFPGRHAAVRVHEWCTRAVLSAQPLSEDDVCMSAEQTAEPWQFDVRAVPFGDTVNLLWREVTHRHLARQRLAAAEEHHRLLGENAADVVLLMRNRTVQWVSPAMVGALGWLPERWKDHDLAEFTHPDDAHLVDPVLPLGATRLRLRDDNGEHHWVQLDTSQFTDPDAQAQRTIASFRLVDAPAEVQPDAARPAGTDPLTGLLNRDTVYDSMSGWPTEDRGGTRQLVAFCDIDDLKVINDKYGHNAGDRLLEAVAQRMTTFLRADDLVARVGGDEMLVIMRGANELGDGLMVLERLLLLVNEPLSLDGTAQVRPQVSIGLTELSPGEDVESAVRRADAAMHHAKSEGGNCVHVVASN